MARPHLSSPAYLLSVQPPFDLTVSCIHDILLILIFYVFEDLWLYLLQLFAFIVVTDKLVFLLFYFLFIFISRLLLDFSYFLGWTVLYWVYIWNSLYAQSSHSQHGNNLKVFYWKKRFLEPFRCPKYWAISEFFKLWSIGKPQSTTNRTLFSFPFFFLLLLPLLQYSDCCIYQGVPNQGSLFKKDYNTNFKKNLNNHCYTFPRKI